jgi:hypothetical protein
MPHKDEIHMLNKYIYAAQEDGETHHSRTQVSAATLASTAEACVTWGHGVDTVIKGQTGKGAVRTTRLTICIMRQKMSHLVGMK